MATYYDQVPGAPYDQADINKTVNTALTKQQIPYLSGLKLNADIVINGLTLNTIGANDVVWVVSDLQGWWSLPDSELPDLPRGWGDGSYDAQGRWANRIITLNGSFLPQKPEDAPAARNLLINAINLIKTGGWLVVYEDKETNPSANGKAAYVRLSGAPQITSVNARGRHDFSIGLKAVDPIKYEYVDGNADGYDEITITPSGGEGSATVSNSGNVAVPIVIEISKGFSIPDSEEPPTITNSETTEKIVIVGATNATNTLEIDTYNREVLDVEYDTITPTKVVAVENGRAKLSVLIDWIYLEPGDNEIVLSGFPSGSSCRILWRSGWIG